MDQSPNLALPYIMAAQAQKHVTHNEAVRALDAIVQLGVLDRDLATPPGSPAEGARYIVAASPTGAWAGCATKIAAFQDGAWAFYTPREGWLAWVADEDLIVAWSGTAWAPASGGGGGGSGSFTDVGINATADTTNRLAVSSPASLLNHAGNGHQLKINKAAAADTASLLFQTAFSGRAEMGTTGDDDFHFKVSSNGSSWFDAININRATGEVTFPNTPLLQAEAGSWTPTFDFATPGDLSVAYGARSGAYVKIGRLVFVSCRVDFTPTYTTASGNAQLTGFPFASSDTLVGASLLGHLAGLTYPAGRTFPVGRFTAGTPIMQFVAFGTAAGSSAFAIAQMPSGTAQQFILSFCYRKTA